MIAAGIILCLSRTFLISDAAFTWTRHDASVDFIQGQTAKLVWTVDVGSGNKWAKVRIYRNKVRSDSGEQKIIDLRESDGAKTKHLSGREADIDLVVEGTSNVVNVTFTLHNLTKTTDEKYYRISLVDSPNLDTESRYTFLRVFDAAFTWLRHDDASVDFVQGQTAKLVWTVDVGNTKQWFKVSIYRNKVESTSEEHKVIDMLKSDGVKNKHLSGRESDIDWLYKGHQML